MSKEQIKRTLQSFVGSGQFTEIRGLPADESKPSFIGFFDLEHIEEAAKCAVDLQAECKGIYFVPNPIRPEKIGGDIKPNSMVIEVKRGVATSDADILKREWLLIDIDPVRPDVGLSSSEEERVLAWNVAMTVYSVLRDAGITHPIIAFSGNGWHLNYPIDLPNDDEAKNICQKILAGLDVRCGDSNARVDRKTYNASRIWKLYGTVSKKGESTKSRPHRQSSIVDIDKDAHANGFETLQDGQYQEIARKNTAALPHLLSLWEAQESARKVAEVTNRVDSHVIARAEQYLAKFPPSIQGANGSSVCFRAASALVEGFALSDGDALQAIQGWNARCEPPWSERELIHKITDARKKIRDLGWILKKEAIQGSTVEEPPPDPDEPDATAEDVYLQNMTTRWAWRLWIQVGMITCVAAEPGVGKTRLLMDIARRIYRGLPWPDGSDPTFPVGSKTLWIPADGQWAEVSDIPTEFGFERDAVLLNAKKSNPFLGTDLDGPIAIKELEDRVMRSKPVMVIVDTIGNSTGGSMAKSEDAKRIFKPFAGMAQRCGCAVILVTHLSKSGEALGRRIVGACRQVIMLSKPNPQEANRRRLWVEKTSTVVPPPLGVSMGDMGNDYDDNPPEAEDSSQEMGRNGDPNTRMPAVMAWLSAYLDSGAKAVSAVIADARREGFGSAMVFEARNRMLIDQYSGPNGAAMWRILS